MNMLQVQDALKNASDDQLMREMQNPSGMAPQFLVLSEMKRRKDMRAQAAPPQGTVAEELLAEGNRVREILPNNEAEPEYEGEDEEMAAGGLVGLRRYAEGGIVRMNAGGFIDGIPFPPNEYDSMTIPPAFTNRPGASDRLPVVRPVARQSEDPRLRIAERELQSRFRADPTMRSNTAIIDQTAEQYGVPASVLRERVLGATPTPIAAPGGVAALASDAPMRPQVAALAEDEPRRLASFPGEQQPNTNENIPRVPAPPAPAAARPGQQRPGQAAQAAATQPPAAQDPPAGLPALAQDPAAPSAAIPDRLSSVLNRINEGRTDPATRRSEAMNMALMEAGLRIAGSNSPRLAGAISEGGVPALQAFSQQTAQIRQDQRQDLRDELQTAIAQNQNDFQRGRLSQQEYATRMNYLLGIRREQGEDRRAGMREAGADARAARAEAAATARYNAPPEAQRLWSFMNPGQTFDPNNPGHVESMNTILTRARGSVQAESNQSRALANPQLREQVGMTLSGTLRRQPTNEEVSAEIRRMFPEATRAGGSLVQREGGGFVYQPGAR